MARASARTPDHARGRGGSGLCGPLPAHRGAPRCLVGGARSGAASQRAGDAVRAVASLAPRRFCSTITTGAGVGVDVRSMLGLRSPGSLETAGGESGHHLVTLWTSGRPGRRCRFGRAPDNSWARLCSSRVPSRFRSGCRSWRPCRRTTSTGSFSACSHRSPPGGRSAGRSRSTPRRWPPRDGGATHLVSACPPPGASGAGFPPAVEPCLLLRRGASGRRARGTATGSASP